MPPPHDSTIGQRPAGSIDGCAAAAIAMVLVAFSSAAPAGQAGLDGFSGNPATNGGATCDVCHVAAGAPAPVVALAGPASMDAGAFSEFTVTLTADASVSTGLNVSVVDADGAPVGILAPLDGDLQLRNGELVHTSPKPFVGGTASYRFRYTAPDFDASATLYVAGVSTDGALDLTGDSVDAGSWSLAVVNGFEPRPPAPPPPADGPLIAEVFATGLVAPVAIANAGDTRLFVVERAGHVRIVDPDGSVRPTPFLDITARVRAGGETGLLGLAFHPDFPSNGHFYVYYTRDADGAVRSRVSRFTTPASGDVADPASESVLLEFEQPFLNHNGGDLHFGPDGYLYIASGDGGSGGDPLDNAQNPGRLLGKLLRIDVNGGAGGVPDCDISGAGNYSVPASNAYSDGPGGAGCDEVYALGLRNPWRFSFDPVTGDLWIGDVGQNTAEEIDRIPAGIPGGLNLGWRCYEGSEPFNLAGCSLAYLPPVYDYFHADGGCSVIGGAVYRGARSPALNGQYFFSDFCLGGVYALAGIPGAIQVRRVVPAHVITRPAALGIDAAGEMFIASLAGGTLYRLRGDVDGDGVPDDEDPDPFDRMNPVPPEALPSRGGWRAILGRGLPPR